MDKILTKRIQIQLSDYFLSAMQMTKPEQCLTWHIKGWFHSYGRHGYQ